MRGILALAFGAVCVFSSSAAQAGYLFGFGGTGEYTLQYGESVVVPVYLQETTTTDLKTYGLVLGGVVLEQADSAATSFATFGTADVSGNLIFGLPEMVMAASDYKDTYAWAANPTAVKLLVTADPESVGAVKAVTDTVQLGSIRFTAGSVYGSTVFQAVSDPESADNAILVSPTDWRMLNEVDAATVTINVVPEPGIVAAVVSGVSCLMLVRRSARRD